MVVAEVFFVRVIIVAVAACVENVSWIVFVRADALLLMRLARRSSAV